jgi:hypothetical protein
LSRFSVAHEDDKQFPADDISLPRITQVTFVDDGGGASETSSGFVGSGVNEERKRLNGEEHYTPLADGDEAVAETSEKAELSSCTHDRGCLRRSPRSQGGGLASE